MYQNYPEASNGADILAKGNIFDRTAGNTKDTGKGFDYTYYYNSDFAMDAAKDVPALMKSQVGLANDLEHDIIMWPGNGAKWISSTAKLQWNPIEKASRYEVFISDGKQGFKPCNVEKLQLKPSTTYFWKVIAYVGGKAYESDVNRFTTASIQASSPTPNNGEIKAPLRRAVERNTPLATSTLTWQNAFDAESYRVYLGKTKTTEMDHGVLSYATDYYWRVDVVKKNGQVVKGKVWKFKATPVYAQMGRTEAEKMIRNGRAYLEQEDGKLFAASGKMAVVGESGPGSMSAVWNGAKGAYSVTVAYFDENDGRGTYQLFVNDKQVDNWTADADNNQLLKHITPTVNLKKGDEIRIEFQTHRGMTCRTDYMEIAPKK